MRTAPFPPEFNSLKRLARSHQVTSPAGKPVRLAIVGDSSTQFLTQAIQATATVGGVNLSCFDADFNQIDRQVFDPGSELYAFEPTYILLGWTSHKCRLAFYELNPAEKASWAADFSAHVRQVCMTLRAQAKAKILIQTLEETDDGAFGNFASRTDQSFLYQTRLANVALMQLAREMPDLFLVDVAALRSYAGKDAFSPPVYYATELVHSLDFTALIARQVIQIVKSLEGSFHKCVILDLDNTLWGGVIGDDGLEHIELGGAGVGKAFKEFQLWIKQLQQRGIILCVCSKNDDAVAKLPFQQHPDMVLKLEDISVFVANWQNKADNIRNIQDILSIGFDSMVFLDDNPVERQLVREQLPDVAVPDLPEDPAEYLNFLQPLGLFETTTLSENDAERTKQYQQEAARREFGQAFTNLGDFLKSLEMNSYVRPFRKFDIPRVAQLSQRSNQFNLRTVRYTEADIQRIAESSQHYSFAFDLEDKFGKHGLIGVVILEEHGSDALFIDTWFMSCRVLKRGMEDFILNELVEKARQLGKKQLIGEYIPTAKNGMVKDHYAGMGFQPAGAFWVLDIDGYISPELFMQKKEDTQ